MGTSAPGAWPGLPKLSLLDTSLPVQCIQKGAIPAEATLSFHLPIEGSDPKLRDADWAIQFWSEPVGLALRNGTFSLFGRHRRLEGCHFGVLVFLIPWLRSMPVHMQRGQVRYPDEIIATHGILA